MWWRGPRAHATVVHGSAMQYAAEALPRRRPDHEKLTPEWSPRYASLRSRPQTGQCSHAQEDAARLDCPRGPLGCQATFQPPSARQRARTDAAPCLLDPPPGGSTRTAPAPLRSARALASSRPRHPPGALRIAYRFWRSVAVPLLPLVLCGRSSLCTRLECNAAGRLRQGLASQRAPAGRPLRSDRQRRCMACQADLSVGGPRSLALCAGDSRRIRVPDAARAWVAGSAGAACP